MGKLHKFSKADIKRFGRLIGLYAQSRSFGLTALIGLSVAVFGLHFGATHVCIRLCASVGAPGWLITVLMIALMIPTVAFWMWGVSNNRVARTMKKFRHMLNKIYENIFLDMKWITYNLEKKCHKLSVH